MSSDSRSPRLPDRPGGECVARRGRGELGWAGSMGVGMEGWETQPGNASPLQESPLLVWLGCGRRAAVWDACCHKPEMASKGRG